MLNNRLMALMQRQPLLREEAKTMMTAMLNCENEIQLGALLALLDAETPSIEQLLGLLESLRAKQTVFSCAKHYCDLVGSGGDGRQSLNISTASALLVSSMGINVVKHGGGAVSSCSGSADVLASLRVPFLQNSLFLDKALQATHFAFCSAVDFSPHLAKLKKIRRALQVPTVMNLLAPLLNPAGAKVLLLGIAKPGLLVTMAQLCQQIGIERGMVVHSQGFDELTTLGEGSIVLFDRQRIIPQRLHPRDYGFSLGCEDSLRGQSPDYNAKRIEALLAGEQDTFADTVCLNAGAAFALMQGSDNLAEAVAYTREHQRTGKAYLHLQTLREVNYAEF